MKISELFHSLQGEGKLVGVPSVFIRASGCNLRCTWCDTPYASWNAGEEKSSELSPSEIAARARELAGPATRHVVLTGGEPLMFKDAPAVVAALKAAGFHVTVETAGTLWPEGMEAGAIDLLSVSPKLANSTPHAREGGRFAVAHEQHRINLPLLRQLAAGAGGVIREAQWKFVISTPDDLSEMEGLIGQINEAPGTAISADHIVLMAEGTHADVLIERSRELAKICKQRGYRLSPRLHVYLWGNTRGT